MVPADGEKMSADWSPSRLPNFRLIELSNYRLTLLPPIRLCMCTMQRLHAAARRLHRNLIHHACAIAYVLAIINMCELGIEHILSVILPYSLTMVKGKLDCLRSATIDAQRESRIASQKA